MMVSKNRLKLSAPPLLWFKRFLEGGMRLAKMSPDVLIASSSLPGPAPNDPSDRIILATAREYDYSVVTRDREILRFAALGHVHAITC